MKQLLAAGARVDVEGVSRGEGPYDPLEWAERKVKRLFFLGVPIHIFKGKHRESFATHTLKE